MKSSRALSIDITLIDLLESFDLSGRAMKGLKYLLSDDEILHSQEFANTVSITRLGYNDHGPVHMRTVTYNALLMIDLLKKAGIKTTLEKDGCGDYEDSVLSVMIGAMFHDIGMGMGRQNHEYHSTVLACPIIDRMLKELYEESVYKRMMVRAVSLETIAGHMGTISTSSLEAGIVQTADGCDMTKGRARIPISLGLTPRVGHIHQFSANSIEKVTIVSGGEKPIRIDVDMSRQVGLFQIEEVLMHKISSSTIKQYIELYANVKDEESRRYL